MLHCTCGGTPDITEVERLMAERTGLAVEYVHMFMDVWTAHADEVLSQPHR